MLGCIYWSSSMVAAAALGAVIHGISLRVFNITFLLLYFLSVALATHSYIVHIWIDAVP